MMRLVIAAWAVVPDSDNDSAPPDDMVDSSSGAGGAGGAGEGADDASETSSETDDDEQQTQIYSIWLRGGNLLQMTEGRMLAS